MTIIKYSHSVQPSTSKVIPDFQWKPHYFVPFADSCCISVALLLGIFISEYYATYDIPELTKSAHVFGLLSLMSVWVFSIWLHNGYSFDACIRSFVGVKKVLKATFYVAGTLAITDAFFELPLVHPYLAISVPAGILLIMMNRILASLVIRKMKSAHPSRLLFVGQTTDILDVMGKNFEKRFPFHTISVLALTDPENQDQLPELHDCQVIPYRSNLDLAHTAKRNHCDAVWVTSVSDFGHKKLRRLAWCLRNINAHLYLEPMLEGVAEDRLSPTPIGPRTVLSIERPRIHAANGHLKRTFDVVFSTITLMLVSPIMIATALAIKLEDGGPVFYKSERIGKKGEPYYVWKFRSMCLDAEDKIKDLIEANGGQSLLFKMKDDPRVTRVGKFIRKYSIDELPQFFNTLQGTMSVVGPRPQVQREVDEYDSDMYMRLEVPPGITGLWQVNGRSNLSPQLAQALDLYYVDNWSFLLDIRIICATLKAVLKSEGAY